MTPNSTRVIIQVNGKVQWQFRQLASGEFIAHCQPLKITLESGNWSELLEDMTLAMDGVLKEMASTNELDRFLHDHGWTLMQQVPVHVSNVQFQIPFELLAQNTKHGRHSKASLHQ